MKYIWMATYHNDTVNRIPDGYFKEYGLKKNDFILTDDDIELFQDIAIK